MALFSFHRLPRISAPPAHSFEIFHILQDRLVDMGKLLPCHPMQERQLLNSHLQLANCFLAAIFPAQRLRNIIIRFMKVFCVHQELCVYEKAIARRREKSLSLSRTKGWELLERPLSPQDVRRNECLWIYASTFFSKRRREKKSFQPSIIFILIVILDSFLKAHNGKLLWFGRKVRRTTMIA